MKAGQKSVPQSIKEARGTARKDREKPEIEVPVSCREPTMPGYIADDVAASAIWAEELDRVTSALTTDFDSSLFARYCALEAKVRALFASGDIPPAAYLVELRRSAESLGIGGAASRIGKGVPSPQISQPVGFAALARRPN